MAKIKQKLTKSQAYSNFLLGIKWDYFITPTTPYALSLPSARRAMERLWEKLCKDSWPGSKTFFWAAEPFDTKDGYHTHALLKIPETSYDAVVKAWQVVSAAQKQGKWARIHIQKYNQKRGASMYCAKYIQKKLADYDIYFK